MNSGDFMESNKRLWNELTPLHLASPFYAVDTFKQGANSLTSIELEEIGDVSGRTLLHLQCHFGLDSLSWARRGAKVVGVDFSDVAIKHAKRLGRQIGAKARFICSSVYGLDRVLKRKFDIVFTSRGVLCWLPDLNEWARIISHFLKRGGIFYIVESHPFANTFADEKDTKALEVFYPYFQGRQPMHFPPGPSYASGEIKLANPSYEWFHPLSDIVNALITNGLAVQFFHEFPFIGYQKFPFLEKDADGWWRLPNGRKDVPLLFSLMAKKTRQS